MNYDYALTIPPNTAKASPKELDMMLTHGYITQVSIMIPRRCVGLAHVVIMDALHQVWPTNPDSDFSGDYMTIEWAEQYPLLAAPYRLTVKGWNKDDCYPHTITVRIAMLPASVIEAGGESLSILRRLYRLIFGG